MQQIRKFCLAGIVGFLLAAYPADSQPAQPRLDPELRSTVRDIVSVGVLNEFRPGRPSNRFMVEFAIYVTALRGKSDKFIRAKPNSFEVKLSDKIVSEAAQRYFGKKVRHETVGDWKYRAGFYYGDAMSFEQMGFEKIRLLRVTGATRGQVTVYAESDDSMSSTMYERDIVVKSTMTFRPVKTGGKKNYLLTSYRSVSNAPKDE